MKPDPILLKEILEKVADFGYSNQFIALENLQFDNVPQDKLQYHAKHLIKERYLEGEIMTLDSGVAVTIERMTDKGALFLDTTENPLFLEWVKRNTGSAFGELMKGTIKGGASLGWGLVKQWLAEQGIASFKS